MGVKQKLPPKFKIVETYGHDHSLESHVLRSISEGTISFLIKPFQGGGEYISRIFHKKPVLKSINGYRVFSFVEIKNKNCYFKLFGPCLP
jgi:hypothetical protein